MSLSFMRLLGKCFYKGLGWGCIQICLTGGLLFLFWIPYYFLFLFYVVPILLFVALIFGGVTSIVVSVVYRLFYNRTAGKTRGMAIISSVVINSSALFITLRVSGNISYSGYWQEFLLWAICYLVYLGANTIWLSWRLSKFAEQLMIESTRQTKETSNFQNATRNAIMQRIKKDYLSHTRYRLDAKLLGLGYDPADIEAAWQTFLACYKLPQFPKSSTRLLLTYYSFNLVLLIGVLFRVFSSVRYL